MPPKEEKPDPLIEYLGGGPKIRKIIADLATYEGTALMRHDFEVVKNSLTDPDHCTIEQQAVGRLVAYAMGVYLSRTGAIVPREGKN